MFNDWAIRKWSKVLSDKFPLDQASFLICSIIPLSYIEVIEEENFVVVNLSDIRKYTHFVKEGCDFLVSKGYAKWLTKDKRNNNQDYNQIAIGTSVDFINATYYFEISKRITEATKVANGGKISQSIDYSDTVKILDDWFERYKIFCNKINLSSKAEKVHKKIKIVLTNVTKSNKITPIELLTYLDCVNAMIYDWTDVPNSYSNIKLKSVAKQVIAKTTPNNIIKVIPYFVENYPTTAKQGYEETNIYNLSFHFSSMLRKVNGKSNRTKGKNRGYDDDKL